MWARTPPRVRVTSRAALGRERDGTDGVQFGIYIVDVLNLTLVAKEFKSA
jgi:hypothetical protein